MIKRYFYALDPGGASGVACRFDPNDTNISGDATFYQGDVNIIGAAGCDVTVQVSAYQNTNVNGQIKVNTNEIFINNIIPITLDGSGNGSFTIRISGNASDFGSIVRCTFKIIGITIGQFGSPLLHQESKVY